MPLVALMIKTLIPPKTNKAVKVCCADNTRPFVLVCFSDQTGHTTLMRAAYRQEKSGTIERLKPPWCSGVFPQYSDVPQRQAGDPSLFYYCKAVVFSPKSLCYCFTLTFILNRFFKKLLKHLHIKAVKIFKGRLNILILFDELIF